MKERKRGRISFLKLPVRNALFPCKNAFEECTTNNLIKTVLSETNNILFSKSY